MSLRATKISESTKPKAGNLLDQHVLSKQGQKLSLPGSLTLTNFSPLLWFYQLSSNRFIAAYGLSSSEAPTRHAFVFLVADLLESSRKGRYCTSCASTTGTERELSQKWNKSKPNFQKWPNYSSATGHATAPVNSWVSGLTCCSFSDWNNVHDPPNTTHILIPANCLKDQSRKN